MTTQPIIRRALRGLLLSLLATISTAPHVQAQGPLVVREAVADEVQELELRDGSRLVGRITDASDPATFTLMTGTTLTVAHRDIASLRTVEGQVRDGRFQRDDPSDNRLFFGPTGRTVGENHGYMAVFEAVFPSVAIGVHDRFTLGAGTLMIGDFGEGHPFWFIPKINLFDTGEAAVSVGALAFHASDIWSGILYGVGTFGSARGELTLGLGYGWVDDDFLDVPIVQVGAATRASDRVKLMTESYFIVENGEFFGLFGGGVRFIGDRLTADLGIGIPSEDFYVLPLVNFVWNW